MRFDGSMDDELEIVIGLSGRDHRQRCVGVSQRGLPSSRRLRPISVATLGAPSASRSRIGSFESMARLQAGDSLLVLVYHPAIHRMALPERVDYSTAEGANRPETLRHINGGPGAAFTAAPDGLWRAVRATRLRGWARNSPKGRGDLGACLTNAPSLRRSLVRQAPHRRISQVKGQRGGGPRSWFVVAI